MRITQDNLNQKTAASSFIPDLKDEIAVGRTSSNYFLINFFIGLALFLKIIYFQFETGLSHTDNGTYENFSMLLCSILFILVFAALSNLIFKGKTALFTFFIIEMLLSILLLADVNSMRYYYKPLSIFLLYDVDFKFFSAVSNAVNTIYKPTDIIFFADSIFILAAILLIRKNIVKISLSFRKNTAIVLIVSLVLLFSTASVTSQSKDVTPNSLNYTARNAGILYSHLENLYTFFTKKMLPHKHLDNNEAKALYSFIEEKKSNTSVNELSGICKGKNLIVLQVEALQNFVIGLKVNGKEITPNLNKFASGSYYFNNMYYQVSWGNTSDAEFLSNSSMYPYRDAAVFYAYYKNKFPSLPELLKQNGYDTSSFHPFDPHFWNRDAMHKNLGFNRFYSEGDYKMDDFAGWEGNALSDKAFFKQSLNKIGGKHPFYSFLITLSSHFPFIWFQDNYKLDTGLPQDSFLNNYLKAINYTDACIGQFMKDLESRRLLDNTVVVIYGDHSAIPKYKSTELMELLRKEYSEQQWTQLQKIPCIIHIPGQKEGKAISSACGQVDIYPTIANILGFKPFTIGKDLFNTTEHYAVLQDYSVITDNYIYLSPLGKVFNASDYHELSMDKYKDEINKLQHEVDISDIIVTKNAFRNGLP